MTSLKLLQKQQQKLSPQQIQFMNLLQFPTFALEQRIKEEIENNPTLEEDEETLQEEAGEKLNQNEEQEQEEKSIEEQEKERDPFENIEMFPDDDEVISHKKNDNYTEFDKNNLFIYQDSFLDELQLQLQLQSLNERDMLIGSEIIGNIDDAGYLSRSLNSMVDDFLFRYNIDITEKEIEKVLRIIQTFDPIGVGARDLRECLLIQLERKPNTEITNLAKKVIEKGFEYFKNKQYQSLMRLLNISDKELKDAIDEIVKLNPKPGNSLSSNTDTAINIIPDFFVWQQNNKVEFQLNSSGYKNLKTSKYYEDLFRSIALSKDIKDKEAAMFLKDKLESANNFIDALKGRNDTLSVIMKAIIQFQYEYFLEGDIQKRKPMRLIDISNIIGLDVSTISRVCSNKYAQTHFGTFRLKDFFSYFMLDDKGTEVSTDRIRDIIKRLVDSEDKSKPFTDDEMVNLLANEGYPIARRTVSKYREGLEIPVARLRKEII